MTECIKNLSTQLHLCVSLCGVVWVRVGETLELLLVDRGQEVLVDRGQLSDLLGEGLVEVGHVQRVTLK